ncbi:hypothetical protein MYX84_09605 [Acidobacteria bacterium AH-259-O06]|nr:hypothetical protein [Acidobacteria bacterium AH-259-O06]
MSTIVETIAQNVADTFPDLSATDQRIAVGLYRLLAEGEPVSLDRLAQHLNVSIANHENTFLLTLDDAHEIGRLTNNATFGVPLKELTN